MISITLPADQVGIVLRLVADTICARPAGTAPVTLTIDDDVLSTTIKDCAADVQQRGLRNDSDPVLEILTTGRLTVALVARDCGQYTVLTYWYHVYVQPANGDAGYEGEVDRRDLPPATQQAVAAMRDRLRLSDVADRAADLAAVVAAFEHGELKAYVQAG